MQVAKWVHSIYISIIHMKFDLSFSRFRKVLFGGGEKDPSCHAPNWTKMVKHTTIATHLQGFHLTSIQGLQRALINLNNWRIKSTPIKYKAQLIIIFQHHKISKQDNLNMKVQILFQWFLNFIHMHITDEAQTHATFSD